MIKAKINLIYIISLTYLAKLIDSLTWIKDLLKKYHTYDYIYIGCRLPKKFHHFRT